jgi:nucleoside 2-deoxyribosyltransferase
MKGKRLRIPKFYLAHPIKDRHEIRKWEKEVEKRFSIELVNPFYDAVEIGNMAAIDRGDKGVYDAAFDSAEIVEGDLGLIRDSDGVIAILTDNVSVGTNMEIFYNSHVLKRPTHIIIEPDELRGHSWLRYLTNTYGGRIYKSRSDFETEYLSKLNAPVKGI